MPRRNFSKNFKQIQRTAPSNEAGKVRYASKALAMKAIKQVQSHNPDTSLSVYQSPKDAGWYLTSR